MSNKVIIECERCGETLTPLESQKGWVSWFADRDTLEVKAFYVTCGRWVNPCADILDHHHKDLWLLDQGLSSFCGSRALWRMQDLLWTYQWPQRAAVTKKMFDAFLTFARIRLPGSFTRQDHNARSRYEDA